MHAGTLINQCKCHRDGLVLLFTLSLSATIASDWKSAVTRPRSDTVIPWKDVRLPESLAIVAPEEGPQSTRQTDLVLWRKRGVVIVVTTTSSRFVSLLLPTITVPSQSWVPDVGTWLIVSRNERAWRVVEGVRSCLL